MAIRTPPPAQEQPLPEDDIDDFLKEDPFAAQTPPPAAVAPAAPPPIDPGFEPPVPPVQTHVPSAAPVVRQRPPRPMAPPPPVQTADIDPFDEPGVPPVRLAASAPPPAPDATPFDEPFDQPVAQPARPVRPETVQPPAAPSAAAPAAGTSDALAAFFAGADLPGAAPADPARMMGELGKAFRAVVAGLRAVLIARATIKSEFRIEQTMIRARGNNPLKFSANDDDALTALLGIGRRTDMTPSAAVEDSLRDIRMHEVAVMAAMQVAVRGMMDELSPDAIRRHTEQGGLAVLPAQRKARQWDAYETRHAAVVQALADDFDSIFGKNFARAYERALAEISSRET